MTTERDTLAALVAEAIARRRYGDRAKPSDWQWGSSICVEALAGVDALLAAGVRAGEAVEVLMRSLDMQQNATRGAVVRAERAEAELAEARAARDEWRASALDEAAHVESLRAVIAAVAALAENSMPIMNAYGQRIRAVPLADLNAVLADPAAALAARDAEALREAADKFDALWNRGHDNSVHPSSYLLREHADRIERG